MIRYRTTHWQRIRDDDGLRITDKGFAKHLRDLARKAQIAFVRLMSACGGEPLGVECKSQTREAWAFVLPDVVGEAPYRVQYFDADGFSGHSCYDTLVKAVEAMIGDGYRVADPGALDRCSATSRWAAGVRRSEWRMLYNQGRVSWNEMLAGFKKAEEVCFA